MIVGLLGDLEGDRDWAVGRLRALGERGDVRAVCQLGDLRFGMGLDHEGYLARPGHAQRRDAVGTLGGEGVVAGEVELSG
ncbi:hypothetical protein SAMN05192575_102447 [Nocardioides alpinus]|uniref:Uncharacterized protein n=1 Tax=Nocardioides alpinus TaxID=748909 RepID=A0A1I0XIU6_9ACTN|nr:hypothetical protein SAMN05192575_102447 [Nocardioides alpinus]